mgnify:CR=1 FL=1
MSKVLISAPEPLNTFHDVSDFDCGKPSLNVWIRAKALRNELCHASRTYVICKEKTVVGYYALASGSVEHENTPSTIRRNMPTSIPVTILARLAIDKSYHRMKLGSSLLKDAILRTYQVSEIVGVRAMLVHALSDKAKEFYAQYGFKSSPIDDKTLFLSIKEINQLIKN